MYYLDPHIHMVSRVTDDYETLAKMGCVGMSEPAFWAGFDRGSVDGFRVGDVALNAQHISALEERSDGRIDVEGYDSCALGTQSLDAGLANAAGGAGDEGDFALQGRG